MKARIASFAEIQQHYKAARRATMCHRGGATIVDKQPFLRRVSAEFHKRLKRAGVYVEGMR